MQYALQVFETEDHFDFRIMDREGEPWFVLADVCRALEIANPRDAAGRLDDDEKDAVGIPDAMGRQQTQTIINESGLYNLILTSRKESAKRFKKWVTSEVLPTIRKTGSYGGRVPAFIRRYNANWDRLEPGYFSVINELVVHLWGRLEQVGHTMADNAPDGTELRPDVSVGRRFSDWLKKNHPTVCNNFTYYLHSTPQAEVDARQYPRALLPLFLDFLDQVWIPECAEDYFYHRDPAALPHLSRLLPSPDRPKPGMMRGQTVKRLRRAS